MMQFISGLVLDKISTKSKPLSWLSIWKFGFETFITAAEDTYS